MSKKETPACEKKSQRPASGKIWDAGSLSGREPTLDNPPEHRELKQRVLDAAWDAIGDALSPPSAKGIAALREGVKPNGKSVIGQPISGPHTHRRPHHLSELLPSTHNRGFKRRIGHGAFRRPMIC